MMTVDRHCTLARGVIACCLLATSLFVADANADATIQSLQLGFSGAYKAGYWTPVQLSLNGGDNGFSGVVRLTSPDAEGIPVQYTSRSIDLAPDADQTIKLLIKIGRAQGTIRAELVDGDRVTSTREFGRQQLPPAIQTSDRIVLELGESLEPSQALQSRSRRAGNTVIATGLDTDTSLPDHWLGFQAVDAVLLTTGHLEASETFDSEQWKTLAEWVLHGGTMVVTMATRAETVYSEVSHLRRVLPGQFVRLSEQRELTKLEQFANATTPVPRVSTAPTQTAVPMAAVEGIRGVIAATEGLGANSLPSVVRQNIGLGTVVLVTFDLDQPPFSNWPDRSRLVARLFDLAFGEENDLPTRSSESTSSTPLGFDDLAGQLRNGLDSFSDVRLIPFSLTALLIAAYVLFVGPLDFWFLKWRGRLEWTWLTMSAIVVGFTVLAVAMAWIWKGREVRVNQACIVDLDAPTGVVRGTSWYQVYSPATAKLTLRTQVSPALPWEAGHQSVVSWQGLPGSGFGGMDTKLSNLSFTMPYASGPIPANSDRDDLLLKGFPLAARSSRSLVSHWWSRADVPASDEPLVFDDVNNQLRGTVSNPLPFALQNCQLMYDRWAFTIGTLSPHQSVNVIDKSMLDLHALMTRRRVVNGRNERVAWDSTDTDVRRILSLSMFFNVAKGQAYSGLENRFQSTIDLSRHLQTNCAVLVGEARTPATRLEIDGTLVDEAHTSDVTYYRIIQPVRNAR